MTQEQALLRANCLLSTGKTHVSATEAASLLGADALGISDAIKRGRFGIPAFMTGRNCRISLTGIVNFLEGRCCNAQNDAH